MAQITPVPAGARVRFWVADAFPGHRVGRVLDIGADTIRVRSASGDSAAYAIASVERLEVSQGTRTPGWGKLASSWMVPGGIVVGAIMGFTAGTSDDLMGWGAGLGAAVGVVGSVALWRTSRTEVWSTTELNGTRMAPVASASSEAAVVRIRPIQPQSRVRLKLASGASVEGTFVEQRGDTIVLSKNAAYTRVPLSTVTAMQTTRGRDRRAGAGVGALWGLGVGAVTGVAMVAQPNSSNALIDPDCPDDGATICHRDSDLTTGFLTVLTSTMVGTAIGTAIGRTRWQRAALPAADRSAPQLLTSPRRDGEPSSTPTVYVAPSAHGLKVGMRATF